MFKKSSILLKNVWSALAIVFSRFDYVLLAVAGVVSLAYVNYWLLYQVTTFSSFSVMVQNQEFGSYSYLYASVYWITTILTIVLFGVAFSLLVWLWKHSGFNKTLSGVTSTGAFFSALGAACPVCGAFLLSLLGVASGIATFPLQGLEFKFLSLALVLWSVVYSANKVALAKNSQCDDCIVEDSVANSKYVTPTTDIKYIPTTAIDREDSIISFQKFVTSVLIISFFVNQFLISNLAVATGITTNAGLASLFSIKEASAATIIAPKLNPDGRTTTLVEQPTITEVPGNPNSGDAVADAKVVMFPTGKPFYAPEDISFDDPINAQKKWKSIGFATELTPEQEARWNSLIESYTCNYCCGGPNNVTTINRCGCAHSYAWQGFFRYMIANYGDKYSDEQLKGEAFRWTGIWYPKGVLEDYLLATGKGDVLGHQTHGGAGSNGKHGL